MLDYFLIGMKSMMKSPVIIFAIHFLAFILLLIIWRRFRMSKISGGHFLAPFHIAKGRFFIHNTFVFTNRIIALSEIKSIDVKFFPSVKLNGARYSLCLELKSGKSLAFFFGKSKQNDLLVKNLKKQTQKYNIRIHFSY